MFTDIRWSTLNGMRRIYLDNAATSYPKAPGLAECVRRYLEEDVVNLYRTDSPLQEMTFSMIDDLKGHIASLYSYNDKECIAFTQNVTVALNAVIKNYVRQGDRAVVSSSEHNSVMRPLNQAGAAIVRIPGDKDGYNDYSTLSDIITPDTKAVILNAASNVSGAVQDLYPPSELCRRYGIPLIIDSAQASPYVKIDMAELDAAAVCFTGHKGLLGPQGTGGMIIRRRDAERFIPLVTGGTGSESDNESVPSYLPDRLSGGTENIPGLSGLECGISYALENLGRLRAAERRATERLYEGILSIKGLEIKGPGLNAKRTSVISTVSGRMDIAEIASLLSTRYGIESRVGLHCSPSSHRTIGTYPGGTLRFSPGPFTTDSDIDTTIRALKEILDA